MSSDFLFAQPSFWEGMARILDFANTLSMYNESLTPEQADYLALKADWEAVGGDLHATLETLENEVHVMERMYTRLSDSNATPQALQVYEERARQLLASFRQEVERVQQLNPTSGAEAATQSTDLDSTSSTAHE